MSTKFYFQCRKIQYKHIYCQIILTATLLKHTHTYTHNIHTPTFLFSHLFHSLFHLLLISAKIWAYASPSWSSGHVLAISESLSIRLSCPGTHIVSSLWGCDLESRLREVGYGLVCIDHQFKFQRLFFHLHIVIIFRRVCWQSCASQIYAWDRNIHWLLACCYSRVQDGFDEVIIFSFHVFLSVKGSR